MADIKISDLTAANGAGSTDLVVISQDTGGGTYVSKKVNVGIFSSNVVSVSTSNVWSISGSYTVLPQNRIVLCDTTSGSIIVTLYTAVGNAGKELDIKKIDSSVNTVTIDGDGSETIDDITTQVISTQYVNISIVSDGTEWFIV